MASMVGISTWIPEGYKDRIQAFMHTHKLRSESEALKLIIAVGLPIVESPNFTLTEFPAQVESQQP